MLCFTSFQPRYKTHRIWNGIHGFVQLWDWWHSTCNREWQLCFIACCEVKFSFLVLTSHVISHSILLTHICSPTKSLALWFQFCCCAKIIYLFKPPSGGVERTCCVLACYKVRANQGQWHEKTSSANSNLRLLCEQKDHELVCTDFFLVTFYIDSTITNLEWQYAVR
jgi:hypothetical protein